MSQKTAIWLDCDTGHDDAFAILLAAYSPEANLLGISTTYGNAPIEHTTYNTRAILKAIGKEDVPVYVGASRPFCRELACAPDIHGETGLDGTTVLPVPTVPARQGTAVQAMYDALAVTPPKTAWIVATGALTNVALLFSIYPAMAEHVAGLSLMGGAVGNQFTDAPLGQGIGNWTPWAEFNIYIDPESARAVFDNPKLKTIKVPLDLTHQFLATKDIQERLLSGQGPRKLFHEILNFFAQTYADVFGLTAGPPVHDPLAVAIVLAPHLFDAELYNVSIITDGEHGKSAEIRTGTSQCGRTVVSQGDRVLIPKSLNKEAVWAMLDECLTAVHLSQYHK